MDWLQGLAHIPERLNFVFIALNISLHYCVPGFISRTTLCQHSLLLGLLDMLCPHLPNHQPFLL